MLDFTLLGDDCVIICPGNIKNALLKEKITHFPYKHVKFLSKQELLKNAYFDYDFEAVYFVHKNYRYNLDLALEILKNLPGIKPFNDKLNKLYEIYLDLQKNNLLKTNKLFKNLFLNKQVYIFAYSKSDLELSSALNLLGVSYTFIENSKNNAYTPKVYSFLEIEDEVKYTFNKIMDLIAKGIDMNKIYIYNYSSEYNLLIKKYANFLNLALNINEKFVLYDSPIYKRFISLLLENDILQAYTILQEEIKNDNYDALGGIIKCINEVKSLDLEKEELIKTLNFNSKNVNLKGEKYKSSINICTSSSIIDDDEYVFMLGFNLGNAPKIYKDVDFYFDFEKGVLGKNTSKIKTMMDKEKMISFLRNVHNLTITMKNKNGKVVYYPSLLIEELNLCVEEGKISSTRYSLKQAQLEVAKYKDLYRLYGVNNQYINNFSDEQLRYMKYDHHFKELPDYHNDAFVRLSYTQIDEYNKCPFQYFVKRVLKTNIFEDSFETRLGSLFHKILEDSISKSIELMDYKEEILETFKSKKEQFFVKLLLPQIKDVLKKNADFDNVTCFSHKLAESEFVVDIDENTKLMGKIDKTIFDDPNKLLAIVDYKTSNFNFNYNKVQYGLNLQLPIYALMLKDKYPDYQIVGLYIQNVCLNKQQLEEGKPYMLNGLTLSELNKLQRLDKEIGVAKDEEGNIKLKSSYINKLALKKNLELTQTTGYEEEFFDNLIASAKEQIDIAISKIREGKFEIAPKKFKHDKGIVCNYCPCKDICFMDSGDIVILDKEDGGDEDEI